MSGNSITTANVGEQGFAEVHPAYRHTDESNDVLCPSLLATIAKEKNIPISVISDSMGHNSEKITRIYLKSINDDVIDRYNDMLIEAISI